MLSRVNKCYAAKQQQGLMLRAAPITSGSTGHPHKTHHGAHTPATGAAVAID
jgi:hypothetical protein